MNIDRPLDEIIQETRNTRRAERAAKRKAAKQTRKQTQPQSTDPAHQTNPPPSSESRPAPGETKLGPSKKRGGISKPQRRRARGKNRANPPSDLERDEKPQQNAPESNDGERRGGVTDRLATKTGGDGRPIRGVKVAVSNLHPGVTETDIKELFETVGPLKKASLKTFTTGQSACEAEVVFEIMADALEAIKRYNMVPLDNQPLHITLATESAPGTVEPVQNRIGKGRGRRPINGGRKMSPERDYDDRDVSPQGNGYGPSRDSPLDDRPAVGNGGHGKRGNRRRYRRFPNNKPGNGNGNSGPGHRDTYAD